MQLAAAHGALPSGDPGERFIGELIERGDRHFEVLFARVLDLVVADAMEALHKHHDRRHAGACDFRGIVQRSRRQAVRPRSGFCDRFIGECDQLIVEWNRLDSQIRSQPTVTLPSCANCSLAALASRSIFSSAANVTFAGAEETLRANGTRIEGMQNAECIQAMRDFISRNPELERGYWRLTLVRDGVGNCTLRCLSRKSTIRNR